MAGRRPHPLDVIARPLVEPSPAAPDVAPLIDVPVVPEHVTVLDAPIVEMQPTEAIPLQRVAAPSARVRPIEDLATTVRPISQPDSPRVPPPVDPFIDAMQRARDSEPNRRYGRLPDSVKGVPVMSMLPSHEFNLLRSEIVHSPVDPPIAAARRHGRPVRLVRDPITGVLREEVMGSNSDVSLASDDTKEMRTANIPDSNRVIASTSDS